MNVYANKTWCAIFVFLVIFALSGQAQTNDTPTLTTQQLASVDNSIQSFIPLIPGQYKGLAATVVLGLAFIAQLVRVYVGWRHSGFFGAIKALFAGGSSLSKTVPILLCAACLSLCGCAGTAVSNTSSIYGGTTHIGLPIPFSGGVSFLSGDVSVGLIKNSTIVAPVSTNRLYLPPMAVLQATRGKASGSGANGTNQGINIADSTYDEAHIAVGDASVSTNSTTATQSK